MKHMNSLGWAAAALLGAALLIPNVTASLTPSPLPPPSVEIPSGTHPGFADLVQAIQPAVVNVSATGHAAKHAGPDLPFESPGSPFEDFFRRFYGTPHGPAMPQPERSSQGSGFIIDPTGYVVTNHHVIDGSEQIEVTLQDGKSYRAELRGSDPKTDLALLKIDVGQELPYVAFGDSDGARVGDWVIAIGNPFGLGGTATTGIISARGRDIQSGPFDDFIQIDAAINRGNSGGPLFDSNGRVIGINTAIFSPNGGNVGIGFAIPASLAGPVIDHLREDGYVERGWLGVSIQEVTPELASGLDLDEPHGALVAKVVPQSPAETAGILEGDVIVAFDGHEVERLRDLPRLVADTKPDERAEVTVWRQGRTEKLKAVVRSTPDDSELRASRTGEAPDTPRLGLSLATLDANWRRRLDLDDAARGVVVVQVDPRGPAARQGVRPGDLIVSVGRQPVDDPRDVSSAVRAAHGESVLLLVKRGAQQRFLALDLA